MLDDVKDRLIMIILIVLIIVILVLGVLGYLFFVKNSDDKVSHKATENAKVNTSSQNVLANTSENTIDVQNNVNTNSLNQNTSNNAPNGSLYTLNLGEVKEQEVTTNNGEEIIDIINIDDFSLNTSVKLKQIGYKIEITNNNTMLNIKSNDGLYSFKLVRLSNVSPYSLDENQEAELDEILDRIAKASLSSKGVSENQEDYYSLYSEEYSNAITSEEALNFYSKYGINRFTSFSGYTDREQQNIQDLLGLDDSKVVSSYMNDSGGMKSFTAILSNGKFEEVEITEDLYPYNGLFMIVENYIGSEYDDNTVEFNFF